MMLKDDTGLKSFIFVIGAGFEDMNSRIDIEVESATENGSICDLEISAVLSEIRSSRFNFW